MTNSKTELIFYNAPAELLYCPITGKVMQSVVVGANQAHYEKSALERWLEIYDELPFAKDQPIISPENKSTYYPVNFLNHYVQLWRTTNPELAHECFNGFIPFDCHQFFKQVRSILQLSESEQTEQINALVLSFGRYIPSTLALPVCWFSDQTPFDQITIDQIISSASFLVQMLQCDKLARALIKWGFKLLNQFEIIHNDSITLIDVPESKIIKKELINWVYSHSNFDTIKWLFTSKFAELENSDTFGMKPVHWVCASGNNQTIRWMIESGLVSLESIDDTGSKPIHWICDRSSDYELIKLVIISGVMDPKAKTKQGETPLAILISKSQPIQLIKDIIELQIYDLTEPMANGSTMIHLICGHIKDPSLIKWLIESKNISDTDLLVSNFNGWKPIHIACANGSSELVQYMFTLGLDYTSTVPVSDNTIGCQDLILARTDFDSSTKDMLNELLQKHIYQLIPTLSV
jgi:ankyrin repeat protein